MLAIEVCFNDARTPAAAVLFVAWAFAAADGFSTGLEGGVTWALPVLDRLGCARGGVGESDLQGAGEAHSDARPPLLMVS